MARLFSILAIGALAIFVVAGCGDDGDDSGATTEATGAAATGSGSDGDAMKDEGDADGDAMKNEDGADGDAMEADDADGDAMKSDGDAMKSDDADGDAMKKGDGADGDAMKKGASTGAAASGDAMVANRTKRGKRGKPVKAVGSEFGRVVADGKGEAFYLFDKEKSKRSQCYGACARAWPPVLTKGRPRAGKGVNQRLLGVTRRKNGKLQVTYKNHPLYYYVDDSPGTILCQNVAEFGGLWLVVKPNGNPVT
jgi:predicted lipoprotein with Yx(FWY)xxD motif